MSALGVRRGTVHTGTVVASDQDYPLPSVTSSQQRSSLREGFLGTQGDQKPDGGAAKSVGGVSQAHSRPQAARAGPGAQTCPVPATAAQGRAIAGR